MMVQECQMTRLLSIECHSSELPPRGPVHNTDTDMGNMDKGSMAHQSPPPDPSIPSVRHASPILGRNRHASRRHANRRRRASHRLRPCAGRVPAKRQQAAFQGPKLQKGLNDVSFQTSRR
jgi:hypothetical protein